MEPTHTIFNHFRYCIVKPTDANAHPYAIFCGPSEACKLDKELTIPAEIICDGSTYPVEVINEFAFLRLDIAILHLPATVREIRHHAFAGGKFHTVTGSEGVETIGTEAFSRCHNLSSFDFSGVKDIGNEAFAFCAFKEVKLGAGLRNIQADSFRTKCDYEIGSIELPASATVIYSKLGFLKPKKLIIKPNNERYICTDETVVVAESGTILWVRPPSERALHIPGYARILNEGLFPCDQEDVVIGSPGCPTAPTSSFNFNGDRAPRSLTLYGEGHTYISGGEALRAVRVMHPRAIIRVGIVEDAVIKYEVQPDSDTFAASSFGFGFHTVEYSDAVVHVPMIRTYATILGENVRSIGTIDKFHFAEPPQCKHPEFKEEYTFIVSLTRCKQIPDIEELEPNSMRIMALIVPRGMKEAYAKHPAWRYAAYIKEEGDPIDDGETTLLRKREMLDKVSSVSAVRCAELILPTGAKVSADGCRVHAELPVVPIPPFGDLTCRVEADIFEASNTDFWEETRAKIEALLSFIHCDSHTI